jgi:MerR family transcriptional regulator/heat shock protein HspR
MNFDDSAPCYIISVAARMLGIHAQTLRYYEKAGVIEPSRSSGRVRLYSQRDIERLRQVRTLMEDLGEVILRLTERITEMERQIKKKDLEIKRLREAGL